MQETAHPYCNMLLLSCSKKKKTTICQQIIGKPITTQTSYKISKHCDLTLKGAIIFALITCTIKHANWCGFHSYEVLKDKNRF